MTLNRNKLIVRYYLWLVSVYRDEWAADDRLRYGTTLCMFFWRIVLGTAGIALVLGFALGLVSLLVYGGITQPLQLLAGMGIVVAIVTLPALIVWLFSFTGKFMRSENMLSSYMKAAKRGICPLIKFSDGDR